ncbi:MAG TPA: dihydropteroate synthase [Verrucomicrobiales bacterium]|nr:dihydropteroate synthase [Verrucomicrobiales bacterium]
MRFLAGHHEFVFPRPTVLMGIVNVTPDSFSDGGRHADRDAAVEHALKLLEEGADILDIGGESTRPNSRPVPLEEELRRVVPVIESLVGRTDRPVSIDTQKPEVAAAALSVGAVIVNDIAANREDPAMWEVVAARRAGYICMHMQGTPQTMQLAPAYDDVVGEVAAFLIARLARLATAGIEPDRVALDVGIGFGKALEHNLALLRSISSFQKLNRPLLLGVSRKSFVGQLSGAAVDGRLPGSIAATVLAVHGGVQMVRTHDVAATRQALRVTEAILNRQDPCGNK